MYQIKCDDLYLYDYRDPSLIVANPKVTVEANTVGSGSFTIYKTHPNYNALKMLKSIFEVRDEYGVLFRGRMTKNTLDFHNAKAVDLEGLGAFFNDSIVPPFNFPDDFAEDAEYISASESGNVIEFFLKWLIDNHNSQVQEFQRFKLGNVTVTDPNNYLTRSESKFANTWETLKSKLFDSALGGKLCIRYEDDGNYIDYLAEFTEVNTQKIEYGENLLDLKNESDANETYSAIIPIGAEIETEVETTDENGEPVTETVKSTVTLDSIADGDITEDIAKMTLSNGVAVLYSKSAVEKYGWIVAPVADTTWDDVTEVANLLTKSTAFLSSTGVMLSDTSEFNAVDLHFTDAEIRSFRIYKKVEVNSLPHNKKGLYDLTRLEIDIVNPQNTKISVGKTTLSLTDKNAQQQAEAIDRIQSAEKDIAENKSNVSEIKNQMIVQNTQIINTAEEIILKALESYAKTSNFEEFKETVSAELKVLSDAVKMQFSSVTEQIENVNGELQKTINEITTFFTFEVDGLTIGKVDNPYKVVIDNDRYSMYVNNVERLWIDAVTGQVHTPELTVTDKFTMLGFLIEEETTTDENGNNRINCDYIGGVA